MESDEENPLTSVLEKYPGYFDKPDLVVPFAVDDEVGDFVDEDTHFPESIPLHEYFDTTPDERSGKSLFAYAMENRKPKSAPEPSDVKELPDSLATDNDIRIARMTLEEIAEARAEIYEKLAPEAIQFLLNRRSKAKEENKEVKVEQKGKKGRLLLFTLI